MTVRLNIPGFVNPLWWRSVEGRSFVLEVADDNCVYLENVKLTGCPFAKGNSVRVTVMGNVYAMLDSDFREIELKKRESFQKKENARKQLSIDRMLADKEFIASLSLPFNWHVGRKDSIHGLSSTSSGNGFVKSTVLHIVVGEDFKSKRISRKKNDFLCTTAGANNGKNYAGSNSDPIEYHDQSSGDRYVTYMPAPTCKQCLSVARNLSKIHIR